MGYRGCAKNVLDTHYRMLRNVIAVLYLHRVRRFSNLLRFTLIRRKKLKYNNFQFILLRVPTSAETLSVSKNVYIKLI